MAGKRCVSGAGARLALGVALAYLGWQAVGASSAVVLGESASWVLPETIAKIRPGADDETGFRPLFGKDAQDGWAQCGPGGFTLTNGVATSHGGMGLWWHTNRTFTNFVVRGEWRLETADADTGVFLRFPDPGHDPWNAVRRGHELEIGDDPAGQEPAWRTGALYPFSPPARVPTRPIGEWNRFELITVGHTYVVRINGETVNVWTDPQRRSGSGYIGLQNYQEGKGSQHRNLRVKDLPPEPTLAKDPP